MGRALAMSRASATRPCGARASVSAAVNAAMTAGSIRRVETVTSTAHQVARVPRTMIPSLRSPEHIGSQNARKTAAPVSIAHCDRRTAPPRRGRRTRLRMNQAARPAKSDGSRIHRPVVEMVDQYARKL